MLKNVTAIFDRKKKAGKTGKGKVELQVKLDDGKRKYIGLFDISPSDWPTMQNSPEVLAAVEKYENIRTAMDVLGEPITLETFNKRLGINTEKKEEVNKEEVSDKSLIDYMILAIEKEKLAPNTLKHKRVVIASLREYGKMTKLSDLTPQNILKYDDWLHETGERKDITIFGYHKLIHKYVRQLYRRSIIDRDPYESVELAHGKSKERQPLTEEELKLMSSLRLPAREDKARNLFIFSAYTGLSYCDMQAFDFRTMTEKHGNLYYIDGSRLKTDTNFFTPILPPAWKILEIYNFHLPRISNQKLNDYLHLVESRMCLNKPLTFHVARHSFATLSLAHDVPIENVSRMLGHTNIRTTQVYAKILKSNIERHAENLARDLI